MADTDTGLRSYKIRTPEVDRAVLEAVAGGKRWRDLDADPDLPSARGIRNWMLDDPKFAEAFRAAMRIKATVLAEQGLDDLSDLSDEDLKALGPVASAAVGVRTSRARYIQWLCSKLDPAQYGEKLEIAHSGGVEIRGVLAAPLITGCAGRITDAVVVSRSDSGDAREDDDADLI